MWNALWMDHVGSEYSATSVAECSPTTPFMSRKERGCSNEEEEEEEGDVARSGGTTAAEPDGEEGIAVVVVAAEPTPANPTAAVVFEGGVEDIRGVPVGVSLREPPVLLLLNCSKCGGGGGGLVEAERRSVSSWRSLSARRVADCHCSAAVVIRAGGAQSMMLSLLLLLLLLPEQRYSEKLDGKAPDAG